MSCTTRTPSKTHGRLFPLPPPPQPRQARLTHGGSIADPPQLTPPWSPAPPNLDEEALPIVVVSGGTLILDDPTDDDKHYVITGSVSLVQFIGARKRIKISMQVKGTGEPSVTTMKWESGASLTDGVLADLIMTNTAGRAIDNADLTRVIVRNSSITGSTEAIHSSALTDVLVRDCSLITTGGAACCDLNACRRVQFVRYAVHQQGSTFGDLLVDGQINETIYLLDGEITGNGSKFGDSSSTGDCWVSDCTYEHDNQLSTPPFTLEDNVQKVCVFNDVHATSDGATCLVLVRQGVPLPEVLESTLDGVPADYCQEPSGWVPSWTVLRPLPGTDVTASEGSSFGGDPFHLSNHVGVDDNITFNPAGYKTVHPGSGTPTFTGFTIKGGPFADQTGPDIASVFMNIPHNVQRMLIDADISSWQYAMWLSNNVASPFYLTVENRTWDDDPAVGSPFESLVRGPYVDAWMKFNNMTFKKTGALGLVKQCIRIYMPSFNSGVWFNDCEWINNGSVGSGLTIGGRDGAPFTSTPWYCGEAWVTNCAFNVLQTSHHALVARRVGTLYMQNLAIVTDHGSNKGIELHDTVKYFWENVTVNGEPLDPAQHITFTDEGDGF